MGGNKKVKILKRLDLAWYHVNNEENSLSSEGFGLQSEYYIWYNTMIVADNKATEDAKRLFPKLKR